MVPYYNWCNFWVRLGTHVVLLSWTNWMKEWGGQKLWICWLLQHQAGFQLFPFLSQPPTDWNGRIGLYTKLFGGRKHSNSTKFSYTTKKVHGGIHFFNQYLLESLRLSRRLGVDPPQHFLGTKNEGQSQRNVLSLKTRTHSIGRKFEVSGSKNSMLAPLIMLSSYIARTNKTSIMQFFLH
jgi:hypothetical protein